MLAKVRSGQPLRYFTGAGWTGSGQFASQQDWQAYVAAASARARSPVKVAVSSAP
jgi:pectinesterase